MSNELRPMLGTKIEELIQRGASPMEMEEMMVVDFLSRRMGKKGIAFVSDGEQAFQCLPVSKDNAQPKSKE